MNIQVKWLRICYWAGAILDGLVVIPMLSPKAAGRMLDIPDFKPDVEYRYAMGVGASLMLGWTFLLLWADRKPVERKGILLLTVFPVLSGLVLSEVVAVTRTDLVEAKRLIPSWIIRGLGGLGLILSYLNARGIPDSK